MNKLKAIIVEDNGFMAMALEDLLGQFSQSVSLAGSANSGETAIEIIREVKPDVVFLDVELQDMTGFELLRRLPDIRFKTVFTTAYSHYAIEAFQINALHYLVKPIKRHELSEAIQRCLASSYNPDKFSAAISNIDRNFSSNGKLILPTQTGTLRFSFQQITHLEGERNYSFIHLLNGGKVLSSKNLAYFEDALDEHQFFRCHRSFIINKVHVESVGHEIVLLKNGQQIPVSRRKKMQVLEWMHV
ncbi:MAG TPA: LytTR family DNA-binding domain-containing protein [Saprospiraceae bacterium]|nr:LytTR family DNA-binding domain-containing protein [Saprospiraceae bacterium]